MENRPVWNNVQRVNHQNQFIPKAVLTRTSRIQVNTGSSTNNVNTARHNFNSRLSTNLLMLGKPFKRTTAPKTNLANQKVNTVRDKAVSAVGGIGKNAIKPSAYCVWRPKRNNDVPHKALENKGIVDSGCSRHMTSNKAYLVDYQDYNGGPAAFGGSKGYITGKDSECLVMSPDFKMLDENQVLLKVPRKNNMYSFKLENIVPSGGLVCLIAKATFDESNKWHMRLGHVNFKNLNKLVKGNLVRGLPSKNFQNDHIRVACQKGKQHKASCKTKSVSFISQPLQLLHMDLFGPTSVRSINHKTYWLVITDDFSRSKGIKREYSNARTPQQNRVAERKNMFLIKAARTMVLVTKTQNRTPYELITGKILIISYIRPFGCHVTILNTIDHLGKFERKCDEGFLVRYSLNSKAFRVYNLETKRVEENLHITFLENKPNVAEKGPNWLFDLDYLTNSMNYQPARSENQANKTAGPKEANHSAGTQDNNDAGNSKIEAKSAQDYFVLPIWSSYTSIVKSSEVKNEDTDDLLLQEGADRTTSTNTVNTASTPVITDSPSNVFSTGGSDLNNTDPDDSQIPALEDIYDNPSYCIFTNASYDDEGALADFTNLESTVNVSPISTSRIHSIHLTTQILGDLKSAVWILVDLPYGKKAIRTKWVYRNKKDERGAVVRNKARIHSLSLDVKSAFLYGKINEEVYVSQPPGFIDPSILRKSKKVYKVVKALYGLHQAPRAWYATLSTFLLKSGYRRGTIDKTLFIKKDKNDIIVKTVSTPIETQKPLVKDEEATDLDVHLYRSMIGSLMYLTTSRPDIMFAVCVCSRFQVTLKTSYLNDVKRIFRYLKGKPKLGLWYLRVSSFNLEAYSDSDYAGANLDKKSTTGGCQFLGRRLISWQCKKQTIVATSTTEAEYIAAANCGGQVLWIQNQMLDYGFNFINTTIYIDNKSTICVVKNSVFHSKTKHIEIRHHFIRDAYEKKLIQVLKIHTDDNIAGLLTKAFDVSRFNFLIVNIGMINQLVALVKGRQDDLLYSLYGMFCEQKNLDIGNVFHKVIWVPESNWREL
ncbi:putative ribonuclease H-like domain-containing protein [Tanacetum coccineum]